MPFGLYDWNVLYQDLRNAPPSLECECGTAVNSTLKSPNSTLTISPHTNILTLRPTTYASDYVCSLENSSVQFTLSNLAHSAWQPSANCALPLCITYSNNNNNSSTCRTSLTPCYDYRTATNMSYCAPGSLCSMLEQCDNVTGGCASNSYVCVVNSCCTPYNVCLPLSWTSLCSSVNDTTSTVVSSTTTASTTSSTTPAPAVLGIKTRQQQRQLHQRQQQQQQQQQRQPQQLLQQQAHQHQQQPKLQQQQQQQLPLRLRRPSLRLQQLQLQLEVRKNFSLWQNRTETLDYNS
ncbi:unnamed protein product [Rotaria socialis]|uniref:Uncharacterized protein n=2 Tax=Rotaria socialis TaxID=392032 RepID=A0A817U1P8_9BILA|nr:unnamed protein product [Rotaria socialis]